MTKQYIGSYTLQDFNDTTFFAEYSLTGLDGSWHTSFQSGDLFMRTKTGESSWSQAIRIVGEDGATGQSVVSVTPQYYLSTSSTSRVGGSWSNEMPTWVSGNYLWTREEVKWENPTDTTFTTEILAKALNSANETAATAQTTANAKNAVYYQESEPTGGTYKANDVWFDTNDGNKMYRWSGTAWIAALFEVGAIGSTIIENGFIATDLLTANNITTGTLDAEKVTISNLDAGSITTGTLDASQVNITNLSAGSIYVGGTTTSVQAKIDEFEAIEIGGRNLILKSADLSASGLGATAGSHAEYRTINVEQSYMDIPNNTEVTISFDLVMTVNTANPTLQVYNSNQKGPKTFASYGFSFIASVGTTITKRCSFTTRITDRTDATLSYNVLEFYSIYDSSNWFSISNLKLEKGNKSTDWTPAPEDVAADIATRAAEVQETARIAAIGYADALLLWDETEKKAFSDGIINEAEKKAIAEAGAALGTATDNLNKANGELRQLIEKRVLEETSTIKSYIRSDANVNLEIGSLSGDNNSKLVQSPEAMTFMVGTIPVATFGAGETDMPKAGIDTELRIGDKASNYHWVSDPDGGMSLIWK